MGVSQDLQDSSFGELFFLGVLQILIDKVLPLKIHSLNVVPELFGVNIMRQFLNLNTVQQVHHQLVVFTACIIAHLLQHTLQLQQERLYVVSVVRALVVGEVLDVVVLLLEERLVRFG